MQTIPMTPELRKALEAAIVALNATAADLRNFGAMRDADQAIAQARAIREAIGPA